MLLSNKELFASMLYNEDTIIVYGSPFVSQVQKRFEQIQARKRKRLTKTLLATRKIIVIHDKMYPEYTEFLFPYHQFEIVERIDELVSGFIKGSLRFKYELMSYSDAVALSEKYDNILFGDH